MSDPKTIQAQHERAVGDQFVDWLSHQRGLPCQFLRRAGEAPDLVYSFRNGELAIEVTDAYYDGPHAEFLWQNARGKPNAPKRWEGLNPDKRLAEAIARCVTGTRRGRHFSRAA